MEVWLVELVNGKMILATQIHASLEDIEITEITPCSSADSVQFSTLECNGCTKNLGTFALFFKSTPSLAYDERMFMQLIADNIALCLDKLNEQERIKIDKITKEKLYISQEIHDSLAQTIYSINLQINALKDSTKGKELQEKLTKLQMNIEQAK